MKRRVANSHDLKRRDTYPLLRIAKRVGGYFKGCEYCGDTVEIKVGNRTRRFWLNGYHVYEMYQPSRHGYMYWCYECGAKDEVAWSVGDFNVRYQRWLEVKLGREMDEDCARVAASNS